MISPKSCLLASLIALFAPISFSADTPDNTAFALDQAPEGDPSVTPLPNGKPWIPGWCRWDWRPTWVNRHKGYVDYTKKNQGKIDVIFYGDSLTQGFAERTKEFNPELHIVNYGIGGDSTRQLLYRISGGEVDGLSPRLIVLMIGTNNLYKDANGGTDEEISKGIAAVVGLLREKLPAATILVLSILPRQNDYFCNRIRNINAIIDKMADGEKVQVFSMWDAFYDDTSQNPDCRVKPELYKGDFLHLAPPGYDVWFREMKPLFDQLTQD